MELLQEGDFPAAEVRACGVRGLDPDSLADVDLVFLAAPDAVSREVAPRLAALGCVVFDLSATFRLEPSVPLMMDGVPNPLLLDHPGIVAGPNCTNVGLVRVLQVLQDHVSMRDLTVTTLQAASGGGRRMLEALDGRPLDAPHALIDNVVPQCDAFLEDGSTGEERRMVAETKRLLGDPAWRMDVTCVRVPVTVGHALTLHIRSETAFNLEQVGAWLDAEDDIHLSRGEEFPTPASMRGKEGVFVGRLRHGAEKTSLQMWVVVDNLLTGAASNAIAVMRQLLPQD